MPMDWSAPLGTIIGAVVGVGSTLLADRSRWRRDNDRHKTEVCRETYTTFLIALSQSHSNMRAATFTTTPEPSERHNVLYNAIDESGIWRARQCLSLSAPAEIITLAITATEALVAMQNALTETFDTRSDRYLRARTDLWTANAAVREAMRTDLGESGPPDPEVELYRSPE
ncbi:hypothetical protein [Actinomadura sp. 9N407]|uniref:hypothetical protein n=1 Tax=Actinomadura sp. 9N407 TaxID=3375154 RepID=UPI0037B2AC4B